MRPRFVLETQRELDLIIKIRSNLSFMLVNYLVQDNIRKTDSLITLDLYLTVSSDLMLVKQ